MNDKFLVVLTTVNSAAAAEKLARLLVQQKLAACVSISSPLTSVYTWQNKMEEAREWLLLIKTRQANYPDVETLIRQNHPYEVPEILALPVARGEKNYLSWLLAQSRKREE